MKIPPANPLTTRPNSEAGRAVTKRGQVSNDAARTDEPDEFVEGGATAERDFASVFEEVVSRDVRRDEEAHDNEGGDRRVSREAERPAHEGKARRQEEREGGSNQPGADGRGGGFETRAGLREVTPASGETAARAILHVADLERIVSAVRAQAVESGRQVVTIELRRSVLEGLKVRLSTDSVGRVTAEFVAASEHVRTQLEARAGELAELLRGRGVNLASLRTNVETGGERPDEQGRGAGGELNRNVSGVFAESRGRSDVTTASGADDEGLDDVANTYRA